MDGSSSREGQRQTQITEDSRRSVLENINGEIMKAVNTYEELISTAAVSQEEYMELISKFLMPKVIEFQNTMQFENIPLHPQEPLFQFERGVPQQQTQTSQLMQHHMENQTQPSGSDTSYGSGQFHQRGMPELPLPSEVFQPPVKNQIQQSGQPTPFYQQEPLFQFEREVPQQQTQTSQLIQHHVENQTQPSGSDTSYWSGQFHQRGMPKRQLQYKSIQSPTQIPTVPYSRQSQAWDHLLPENIPMPKLKMSKRQATHDDGEDSGFREFLKQFNIPPIRFSNEFYKRPYVLPQNIPMLPEQLPKLPLRKRHETQDIGQGSEDGADWREDTYSKIKPLFDKYYDELSNLHQQIVAQLKQPEFENNKELHEVRQMTVSHLAFLGTKKEDLAFQNKNHVAEIEEKIKRTLKQGGKLPK